MGSSGANAVLQIFGGILGAAGEGVATEGKRDALRYQMGVAREQQRITEAQLAAEGERIRSENIVKTAKSGVRREGSPVEVMASNAAAVARKIALSQIATNSQIEQLQTERQNVTAAGALSASSQLLGAGAGAAQTYAVG